MKIDSSILVPLLRAFGSLSDNERQIFLYCLLNLPRPALYSSDVRSISTITGYHVRTVQKALRTISKDPMLGRCVQIIRITRQQAQEIYTHAALEDKNSTPDHV